MCGYLKTDLHLLFFAYAKSWFSHDMAHIWIKMVMGILSRFYGGNGTDGLRGSPTAESELYFCASFSYMSYIMSYEPVCTAQPSQTLSVLYFCGSLFHAIDF